MVFIRNFVALVFLLAIVSCNSKGPADISGTWETEAPVPYIVEHTTKTPQGSPVPHKSIQLLERSATIKWTLIQRPDGLVVGTNEWVAYDENDLEVFRGSEPLVGTYDGKQLILVESDEDGPQLKFELTSTGTDRFSGVGHGIGVNQLSAIRFELVRKR